MNADVEKLLAENNRLKKEIQDSQDFLNIAPAFFGILTVRGEVLKVNDLALQIIECPKDQVIAQLFWECPWWKSIPDSAKRVKEATLSAASGSTTELDIEYAAFINGTAQKRWVALVVKPLRDKSGMISNTTASGIDITDRKVAQYALSESQQQLARAIAVSKVGFYDWDIVKNHIKFSKQMKTDWGLEVAPELGAASLQEALARIHPDDRAGVEKLIAQSMDERIHFRVEYRVVRRDGKVVWIEAQGEVSYDDKGKPTRFFGTSIDITQRKKAQGDLDRTSSILNSIVNSSTDTIYLKDRQSRMIFANPQTLKNVGATEEEIYGKNDLEFLGPGNGGEEILVSDERIMSSGVGETVEESVTWNDKSNRVYMSSKQPHRDSLGKIVGLVGISRDITELKKTQGDLEEALRIRDTFLSIASHELKTPLTSLKLQSQMSKRTLEKRGPSAFTLERLVKLIDNSNTQADRLSRLVDDMLDISRISSGKLTMNLEEVDLAVLVEDTLNRFSQQFEEAGIAISKKLVSRLPIKVDPFRFEQVLANLISNATKYAPRSQIFVTLESGNKSATLKFRDGGPGIPVDKHEVIFERFERLGMPNQVTGLGLGLNISREIVRAHGGEIRVESQPGKGAEFIVTLPLGRSEPTSKAASSQY